MKMMIELPMMLRIALGIGMTAKASSCALEGVWKVFVLVPSSIVSMNNRSTFG